MLLGILMKSGNSDIPLILSVDDPSPSGNGSGMSMTGFVTSDVATVSIVSGGIGPYDYSWAQVPVDPADSGPYTVILQDEAATAWNDPAVSSLDTDSNEDWTCTVTDTGNNNKMATIVVSVTLTWTDTT